MSARQLLSVARAARLAGVSRGEIQKRIRGGELRTFEGMVQLAHLRDVYPELDPGRDRALERAERIRHAAVHKLHPGQVPAREQLLAEVHRLRTALSDAQAQIEDHRELVHALEQRLTALQASCTHEQRLLLQALVRWMAARAGRGA